MRSTRPRPSPDFLLPLRDKAARWLGLPEASLVHALVSEYRPGTALGWHRDVPKFEAIVGISLGGTCRMRLRPYRPGEKQRREDAIAITLEARSVYSITGTARWGWQHSIPPRESCATPSPSERHVGMDLGPLGVMRKLARDFYDRDTILVARELLGKCLVHRDQGVERVGRIVEAEAYLGPHDLAAHSSKGLTPRTRSMFGPPGHAYVYLIYGMHHCMNVVTQAEGTASAVLLRALEPIRNIEERTKGPGLLCRALGIDRRLMATI